MNGHNRHVRVHSRAEMMALRARTVPSRTLSTEAAAPNRTPSFCHPFYLLSAAISVAHVLAHVTRKREKINKSHMRLGAVDRLPVANTFHLELKLNLSPAVSARSYANET